MNSNKMDKTVPLPDAGVVRDGETSQTLKVFRLLSRPEWYVFNERVHRYDATSKTVNGVRAELMDVVKALDGFVTWRLSGFPLESKLSLRLEKGDTDDNPTFNVGTTQVNPRNRSTVPVRTLTRCCVKIENVCSLEIACLPEKVGGDISDLLKADLQTEAAEGQQRNGSREQGGGERSKKLDKIRGRVLLRSTNPPSPAKPLQEVSHQKVNVAGDSIASPRPEVKKAPIPRSNPPRQINPKTPGTRRRVKAKRNSIVQDSSDSSEESAPEDSPARTRPRRRTAATDFVFQQRSDTEEEEESYDDDDEEFIGPRQSKRRPRKLFASDIPDAKIRKTKRAHNGLSRRGRPLNEDADTERDEIAPPESRRKNPPRVTPKRKHPPIIEQEADDGPTEVNGPHLETEEPRLHQKTPEKPKMNTLEVSEDTHGDVKLEPFASSDEDDMGDLGRELRVHRNGKNPYHVRLKLDKTTVFLLKLLEGKRGDIYSVWFRTDRAGKTGNGKLRPCGSDLQKAKTLFQQEYMKKTGVYFDG